MAYCLAVWSQANVLTFSMILMLNNIQVRALDLSDSLVYVHVSSHDLTSHQQFLLCFSDWSRRLEYFISGGETGGNAPARQDAT